MRRLLTIFCLLLTLTIPLSSCANQSTPAQALSAVQFLCADESTLPDGELYVIGASIDGTRVFSEELQAAFFGDGARPAALDEATVGVSYLSYAHPFEITLFSAKSADGAKKLAKMLLRRRDAIIRQWESTAHADYVKNATVIIHGNWVLLSVTRDAEATSKRLRRAV